MAEIQSIQSYKTSDGEVFLDREAAMAHEKKLEEARELEQHRADIEHTVTCYINDQANKGVKGFDSDRGRKQKANVARNVIEWLATWDKGNIEIEPTPAPVGEQSISEVLAEQGEEIPAVEPVKEVPVPEDMDIPF